jgi:predicted MFS family arabinose efflux permease
VAVACITLASLLAPFGWVSLAAMLSAETPAGQATTIVLAISIYSLGAAAGGAAGGAVLALGGYPALGFALPLAAAAAVVPVWRRGRWTGAVP